MAGKPAAAAIDKAAAHPPEFLFTATVMTTPPSAVWQRACAMLGDRTKGIDRGRGHGARRSPLPHFDVGAIRPVIVLISG
ncbi:hypothetical protein AB0H42_27765 [Nocardia sp. NPDC050799]|uniref:hypothetical protein n=1 Tax=Nocardia sp. NPDC050799 TaxID=3154842 RepID=UPI0033FA80E6